MESGGGGSGCGVEPRYREQSPRARRGVTGSGRERRKCRGERKVLHTLTALYRAAHLIRPPAPSPVRGGRAARPRAPLEGV